MTLTCKREANLGKSPGGSRGACLLTPHPLPPQVVFSTHFQVLLWTMGITFFNISYGTKIWTEFNLDNLILKCLFGRDHKPVHSWSPCRCDHKLLTTHFCPGNQSHQHSLHSRLLATALLQLVTHILTINSLKKYHFHVPTILSLFR